MAVPVLSLATVVVVAKLIGNRLERAGETPAQPPFGSVPRSRRPVSPS